MTNTVKDIVAIVEQHYPPYLSASWDNCGLQVGSYHAAVTKIGVTLELEPEVIKQALNADLDLIITHHPLFFNGIKGINADTAWGQMIYQLISQNIAVYSAHTTLDAAPRGLNQHLAEMLGLQHIEPLFADLEEQLYKIVVYVPASHVKEVQQAMAAAGAGHIGNYSACTFRTPGIGTFRPEAGSQPYIGSAGVMQEVAEYRLETVVEKHGLTSVIVAMQTAHPYEEVAYDVFPLINRGRTYSMGRKGCLPQICTLDDLSGRVKQILACQRLKVVGNSQRQVERVALISGSGGSMLSRISPQLADVVITGDVKYHEAQEARLRGISIIDAGHQELEKHMIPLLAGLLKRECENRQLAIEVLELGSTPIFRNY